MFAFTDMAVVAHSLAKEQVQRTKADTIMARIYDVSESDRGKIRGRNSPRTSSPPA